VLKPAELVLENLSYGFTKSYRFMISPCRLTRVIPTGGRSNSL
jgi:hypothetical protein